jgi:hypothetical protein
MPYTYIHLSEAESLKTKDKMDKALRDPHFHDELQKILKEMGKKPPLGVPLSADLEYGLVWDKPKSTTS